MEDRRWLRNSSFDSQLISQRTILQLSDVQTRLTSQDLFDLARPFHWACPRPLIIARAFNITRGEKPPPCCFSPFALEVVCRTRSSNFVRPAALARRESRRQDVPRNQTRPFLHSITSITSPPFSFSTTTNCHLDTDTPDRLLFVLRDIPPPPLTI